MALFLKKRKIMWKKARFSPKIYLLTAFGLLPCCKFEP